MELLQPKLHSFHQGLVGHLEMDVQLGMVEFDVEVECPRDCGAWEADKYHAHLQGPHFLISERASSPKDQSKSLALACFPGSPAMPACV